MTFSEAREKLKGIGGDCISYTEFIGNSPSVTIYIHKDGQCFSASTFEGAFSQLENDGALTAQAPEIEPAELAEIEAKI